MFTYGAEERLGNENKLLKLNELLDWPRLASMIKGLYRSIMLPKNETGI